MRKFLAIVAVALLSGPVLAAELVVVDGGAIKAGGKSQFAFDVISDGDVSALQYAIQLPGRAKSVDTSGCLAELPSTHTGLCQANLEQGMVAVVIWSAENKPLPKGAVPVGRVSVDMARGAGSSKPKVVGLDMSGPDSRPVVAKSTISDGAAPRGRSQPNDGALKR
jgi:hypothetical protein